MKSYGIKMALCAGVTGFRGCGFAGWDPLGRLGRPGPRMAPGSPTAVRAGASVVRLKVRECGSADRGRLGRLGPRMAPGSPMAVRAGASVIRLKVRVCGAKGNLTDPSDRSDRSDLSDQSAGWLTQSHSHKVTQSCPPCGQPHFGPFRKSPPPSGARRQAPAARKR